MYWLSLQAEYQSELISLITTKSDNILDSKMWTLEMPMVNQLKNLFNMFQKIKKNYTSNTTIQLYLLLLLYMNY